MESRSGIGNVEQAGRGHRPPLLQRLARRRFADLLLFGVTSAELVILLQLTPTFSITDWIYLLQHVVVLVIALSRPAPQVMDRSLSSSAAVAVAYTYPYAEIIYLRWSPGEELWPEGGLVLVTLAAVLSMTSLAVLGKFFGIRPAMRGLVTKGPYGIVRHPMYLAYIARDIGYNFQEWNWGTVLLTLVGWMSLAYRIRAEERALAQNSGWTAYEKTVRYRLIPGIW